VTFQMTAMAVLILASITSSMVIALDAKYYCRFSIQVYLTKG